MTDQLREAMGCSAKYYGTGPQCERAKGHRSQHSFTWKNVRLDTTIKAGGVNHCPQCHRQVRVGYSWWCDDCEIGGTRFGDVAVSDE